MSIKAETAYLDLMTDVFSSGIDRPDRTGTGTRSLFGEKLVINLQEGFPLLTTKYVNFRAIVEELLWFLRGETNINTLNAKIWDEWATDTGLLGPIYGAQWRNWLTPYGTRVDQVAEVVRSLKEDPYSRRHIISAWNPSDLPVPGLAPNENPKQKPPKMALAPCHCLIQFYVANGRLSCQMYQRSADLFLGVPFNMASYALLTHILAAICEYEVGYLHLVYGDVHLYDNHLTDSIVYEQVRRVPKKAPTLTVSVQRDDPADYVYDDFMLEGYSHSGIIKAPIAV